MKKSIKKFISFAIVLCIVFSAISVSFVAMAETGEYEEIFLDTPVNVTVTEDNPLSCFYFTPEESGTYFFSSSGSEDTYGSVLILGDIPIETDDDGGEGNNFKVAVELIAWQTYTLQSRLYSYQ